MMEGGLSYDCINQVYIPVAGHVLGLNIKPHSQLDLEKDLARAIDFLEAKNLSDVWIKNARHSLNRFRHFLQLERGIIQVSFDEEVNLDHYHTGLPSWLVEQLTRYQHIRQVNWRPARLNDQIKRFWCSHTHLWRWILDHYPVDKVTDIKRQYVFDYIDHRLAAGYAPSGINQNLRSFHAFLCFLREQDFLVPEALLRIRGLKEPDGLPRFLIDEQVNRLRVDLEERVRRARTPSKIRDSLIDRAAFYLLWQGGMRLGEVEELRLEDLDLSNQRLTVRHGKGQKDRTVYLTSVATSAIRDYLSVRGSVRTNHVFAYRTRPLCKDFIRGRIKEAGRRVGVKVTPHRLRHTYATQLVNAGCRITSIQQLLGHQHINTTLVYARLHNQTVADDYYAAMEIIEQRMILVEQGTQDTHIDDSTNISQNLDVHIHLLEIINRLDDPQLDFAQRLDLTDQLRHVLNIEIPIPVDLPDNGRITAMCVDLAGADQSW